MYNDIINQGNKIYYTILENERRLLEEYAQMNDSSESYKFNQKLFDKFILTIEESYKKSLETDMNEYMFYSLYYPIFKRILYRSIYKFDSSINYLKYMISFINKYYHNKSLLKSPTNWGDNNIDSKNILKIVLEHIIIFKLDTIHEKVFENLKTRYELLYLIINGFREIREVVRTYENFYELINSLFSRETWYYSGTYIYPETCEIVWNNIKKHYRYDLILFRKCHRERYSYKERIKRINCS